MKLKVNLELLDVPDYFLCKTTKQLKIHRNNMIID